MLLLCLTSLSSWKKYIIHRHWKINLEEFLPINKTPYGEFCDCRTSFVYFKWSFSHQYNSDQQTQIGFKLQSYDKVPTATCFDPHSPIIIKQAIVHRQLLNFFLHVAEPLKIPRCVKNTYEFSTILLHTKLNSVVLVRTRTIPTERPPPVGELSANFCG